MKNWFDRKTGVMSVLAALLMFVSTYPANAANGDGFSRGKGVIARIGAGTPANFDLGAGYRFNPHFALAMEAYSYSGLTTFAGVMDARYHILDSAFTPFVATKIGYGELGMTIEYGTYQDILGSLTAGLSWRGFDLGAGIIYDSFHKMGFTANLSWTYCFRIHSKR
ncbi:MAG: hypothetical protein MJY86_05415 [Bacteroidales bacterium]|nr:hypothetical protein [Bacteroidales bacterium]